MQLQWLCPAGRDILKCFWILEPLDFIDSENWINSQTQHWQLHKSYKAAPEVKRCSVCHSFISLFSLCCRVLELLYLWGSEFFTWEIQNSCTTRPPQAFGANQARKQWLKSSLKSSVTLHWVPQTAQDMVMTYTLYSHLTWIFFGYHRILYT